jgi:hypothetical protein
MKLIFIIIFIILFCIFIIKIFIINNYKNYKNYKSISIKDTIDWLYQSINEICYECKLYPIYTIKQNDTLTFSEKIDKNKGIIYISLWDDKNDRLYSNTTLLFKTLHEISNILSENNYNFDFIEKNLINTAINLGFYDINDKIEQEEIFNIF